MPPKQVDTDASLSLLCHTDRKRDDDQHHHYSPDRLHQVKNDDEAWVECRLESELAPLRREPEQPGPPARCG